MSDEQAAEAADEASGSTPAVARADRSMLATPPEDEVAAILAAVEVAWPKPVAPAAPSDRPSRWRFSGRWWSAPIPLRRVRPW